MTHDQRRRLPKTFEGLQVDSELLKDSVEQGRPDVTPAVNGNSRRPAVFVQPPLVNACLTRSLNPSLAATAAIQMRGALW